MNTLKTQRLSFSEREQKILDAAGRLFAEKGFEGTTTRAIALEAGVNEALLFRHFKSKEGLYTALLQRKLRNFEANVGPSLHLIHKKPLKQGLLDVAQIVVDRHREDSWFMRVMLYAALESHHLGQLFFKQRLPLLEFLQEFFAKKAKSGEVKGIAPAILARAYLALVSQYVLITQVFNAKDYYPLPEKKMLEHFVEIFTTGVLP